MSRYRLFIIISLIFISTFFKGVDFSVPVAQAASSLSGRILLQVESHGEAWYVNPLNSRRYYLGRPDDAFKLMRSLGLGINNKDFSTLGGKTSRLAGRILIKVEDSGRAYYFDPSNLRLYYLGRPDDAFRVMRQRGLGITNTDLSKILVATNFNSVSLPITNTVPFISANQKSFVYNFKYSNVAKSISLNLSSSLYNQYTVSPKVLSYQVGHEPANLRDAFYALFLKLKSGDTSILDAINKLKVIAAQNNLSSDETAALVMAWVQYIPYDHVKFDLNPQSNNNPYFPYETLYLDKGVCSDKTFLALSLLRKLGYGAAILDFPDLNHTAVGIQCDLNDSINSSGYCYIETTNYFPVGVIPQTISSGQANNKANEFVDLFNPKNLGRIEILQKTSGLVYHGLSLTKAKVNALKNEENYLNTEKINIDNSAAAIKIKESNLQDLKIQLDNYYNNGQTSLYNSAVINYNNLVNEYNSAAAAYSTRVDSYTRRANIFYQSAKDFYQK